MTTKERACHTLASALIKEKFIAAKNHLEDAPIDWFDFIRFIRTSDRRMDRETCEIFLRVMETRGFFN